MTLNSELKHSLLLATLDASLDGVLLVDHRTRKVLHYNPRFLDLWGIPAALADQKDDNKLLRFVLEQLASPKSFIDLVEELYIHPERLSSDELLFKDGRVFDRHSAPLVLEGEACARVWFFRDVTELKAAEAKLIFSSKMSSLGEMAGGIAHEINNPLAIICGKVHQLKRALAQGEALDRAGLEADLTKIEATTERIDKIVQGLTLFSRNAEHDPMEAARLAQIVNGTLELLKAGLKNRSIELLVHCETDLAVECRPAQISQILANLLSNSMSAVERLPEKWIAIDATSSGAQVSLSVTDSGSGIPPEIANRIMEPFFTTKEPGKGTGLGLSISKGIAEGHGGQLRYDASFRNTRFILDLPVRQEGPRTP